MTCGKSALVVFLLVLVLPIVLPAYTSENYSIPNIAIEPSSSGSSENYLVYDAGEEPSGSSVGSSANYSLTTGFPATVGVLRVPGSLNITVDSNTQLTVSWDSNGNPPGASFQLQETSPVPQSLYSGTGVQFIHSSLTPNHEYCYRARAFAGVYTVFSREKCAFTLPNDPDINSDHTENAWSTDANVKFTAASDANNFYYVWNQNASTSVTTSDTFWDGNTITLEATSDGNWYFHVIAANGDNNLNAGGTVHYGPYTLDVVPPVTTDDANSNWQTTDVHVTLTATDVSNTQTYYCIDLNNSCNPVTSGTSFDVTCSTTCQQYIRYYSVDAAGNTEIVESKLIKIDKEAPPAPDVNDEGTTSYDFVLTFTYSLDDNSGSGVSDFFLELHRGSTDGAIVYEGWTGDSDGSYDFLGAENTYKYFARAKVRDAVGHESAFSGFTDGVYVNATAHPASDNYALDIYTILPSAQVDSNTYSIYDLVVGQPAVSMSSANYSAETGFAGGFMENSAPTLVLNSPNQGYYALGIIPIDFNVIDAENDRVYLTIAYSLTKGGFQHKLLSDVNLNDYENIAGLNCDNNTWSTSTNCTFDWNIASVQDNNYYVDLNAWDPLGASNSTSSIASITIDKTMPVTSSDYNGEWSGVDLNVSLSCSDGSGSDCAMTQYRLDSNPSKTIEFGAWQVYSEPFEVKGDGNYAIDFNSRDIAGNVESTNRQYVLINHAFSTMQLGIPAGYEIEVNEDMNKQLWYKCIDIAGNVEEAKYIWVCLDKLPPTTLDDINSAWRDTDLNVLLSASDLASGVKETYYCIDDTNSCNPLNGSTGAAFTVHCDENNVCRKYVRYLSVDNAGNTETVRVGFVRIDKNAPVSRAEFVAGWQGDLNIVVSCSDFNGSGCSKLVYRLDSGSWQETAFVGSDANISITSDGNHLVEYYAVDVAGSAESVKRGWQAVDKTLPSVTITDPSTDYMEKGTPTISFNVGRLSGSAINIASIIVDFNGTPSDDFNAYADCTANAVGDYNCSYTESGLAEDDYNLSVTVSDAAGNTSRVSRVFTLKAVIGVRNVTPSGGLVTGTQQIRFEVKNTMLNDVYAVIYYSNWFGRFDNNITGTLHLDDYAGINGLSCEGTSWWNWTPCTYTWNSVNATDGNYFIDINFWNASGGTATGHSTQDFLLDNTPPHASVLDVSPTPVFSDKIYLGCSDAGSGCKQLRWYYFSPTASCSNSKSDYNYSTALGYINITTDHNDFVCLWVEDNADLNDTAVSTQLHVDRGVYVVESAQSESQQLATQDLNNACSMYFGRALTVSCDFKSTLKFSEWAKDLNRVWGTAPNLVVSPNRTVRVLLERELEAFYNKDYFLKFESSTRTITSRGNESNYPITVVKRQVVPLLTVSGQLEVGVLTIKIRQK